MHELPFADSARLKPCTCLGLPLRTFALGHELAMLAGRNALFCLPRAKFEALSAEEQRQAITDAAFVCSQTHSEFHGPDGFFARVLWRINIKCFFMLWRWKMFGFFRSRTPNYALEIAEFRNYLADGRNLLPALSSEVPEDDEAYEVANEGEKLGGGRSLGAPFLAQVLDYAITRGLSVALGLKSPFDVPFALAGNLYFAHLETLGQIHIENAKEAQVRAEMAQHRADVAAEKDAARKAWTEAFTDDEKRTAIQKHWRILDLFPEAAEFQMEKTECPTP